MTEQEVLAILMRNGEIQYIYADDYKRLVKNLGVLYFDVRNFCKSQGAKDIMQWLNSKGLYRDVESDMRETEASVDFSGSEEMICAQLFEFYPLVGEMILPRDIAARILSKAQDIFDRIIDNDKTDLTGQERDIITIAILQFLKRREFLEDSQVEQKFWPYIFSQFGFKQENDEGNTQRIYNILRAAVRGAFLQHHRFFSSEKDTQQYYTSLRLHSLTPAQSMESLFEILLFFYMNDLDFTYTPEDSAFKALVNCIAKRWDKDIEQQEGLSVRSNAMASGLKALFTERPIFMRKYCEKNHSTNGCLGAERKRIESEQYAHDAIEPLVRKKG